MIVLNECLEKPGVEEITSTSVAIGTWGRFWKLLSYTWFKDWMGSNVWKPIAEDATESKQSPGALPSLFSQAVTPPDPTITVSLFHAEYQGVPPSATGDHTSHCHPGSVPSTAPTPPESDHASASFQTGKFGPQEQSLVLLNHTSVTSPRKSPRITFLIGFFPSQDN